ncbi:hypothetical protein Tco_0014513, partial [Tanacetum coccineum]
MDETLMSRVPEVGVSGRHVM